MTTPTLQQIKEVVTQVIEPFAQSVQKDFQRMDQRFDGVENCLGTVEGRLIGVEECLVNVEDDVRWMKENSSALFEKLDRMIALFEKHEQEIAAISVQMKRM